MTGRAGQIEAARAFTAAALVSGLLGTVVFRREGAGPGSLGAVSAAAVGGTGVGQSEIPAATLRHLIRPKHKSVLVYVRGSLIFLCGFSPEGRRVV